MTIAPVDVTGTVRDWTGEPLAGVRIELQSGLPPATTVSTTTTRRDGGFQLARIIPDDYLLQVSRPGSSTLRQRLLRDGEWSQVEIVFPDTITVEGRIRHDGAGPIPFDASRINIMAFTVGDRSTRFSGVSSNMNGGQVRPDGTFTLTELAVPAQLLLRGGPQEWTLKTLRVDDIDVTYERAHVDRGATHAEFILTDQASDVIGLVTDEQSRPVANCTVVVFPANPDLRQYLRVFVRGVRPNQHGQFRLEQLPPADYLAIAMTGLRENVWADLVVLNRLWSNATPFRVDWGQQQVLQLELSPTPPGL
jgi:hypothetical protein